MSTRPVPHAGSDEPESSARPAVPRQPDPPTGAADAGGRCRPPGRPGRPLGPVAPGTSSAHRAWLGPVREAYLAAVLASGLTMSQLGRHLHIHKSKISELMSGKMYPRWELLYTVAVALDVPFWPLYRLWRQAALETQSKTRTWVEDSTSRTTMTATRPTPPIDLNAFRNLTESGYHLYASVFLADTASETTLEETYDQLWLSWPQALASPDARRYAFHVLRAAVMSRTPHIDGRPEFLHAAFCTVALQSVSDEDAAMEQLTETLALFKAMGRLPDNQLDVMVLRRLCGMNDEDVSHLLGVPLATVRSDERHATRFLEDALCPPPSPEGNLP